MGLIYNPNESQELVSNFEANIKTCEQILRDLKKGNTHLVNALNGNQLSGAAFTAGKGLFTQLVMPTVAKADTAIRELNTRLQQYIQYTGAAGSEILDEDKLEQQLQELRNQQTMMMSQIRLYQNQARVSETPEISAMCYDYANTLNQHLGTLQDDIRKVEEKLKKLHELDMKIAPLFSGIASEFSNICAGVSAIGSAAFDSSGKFKLNIKKSDIAHFKDFVGDIYEDTKNETLNTILQETIKDGIESNSEKAAALAEENIWKNRYATELANGKIMGKVPGATASTMRDAEQMALQSGKTLGRCVTGGFAVVGGIMDGFSDYQEDKDVGKAVAHGALSIGGSVAVAVFVPGIGWGIAASVVVGIGVNWLFEKKFTKDFFKAQEKKIGKALKGVSDFFGSVGKVLSW